jgi:hypothetical protein
MRLKFIFPSSKNLLDDEMSPLNLPAPALESTTNQLACRFACRALLTFHEIHDDPTNFIPMNTGNALKVKPFPSIAIATARRMNMKE